MILAQNLAATSIRDVTRSVDYISTLIPVTNRITSINKRLRLGTITSTDIIYGVLIWACDSVTVFSSNPSTMYRQPMISTGEMAISKLKVDVDCWKIKI